MAHELHGGISQMSQDFEALEIGEPLPPTHPDQAVLVPNDSAPSQGDPILTKIQELQVQVRKLQSRYVSPTPDPYGNRAHGLTSYELLEMRVCNSTADDQHWLRYPPGIITNRLPKNIEELKQFTGKNSPTMSEGEPR